VTLCGDASLGLQAKVYGQNGVLQHYDLPATKGCITEFVYSMNKFALP